MDPQRRSWPQTRIALLHPSPHSRRHTREAHPPSPHSRLALHPPAPTRERATASAPNPRARTSHDSAWLQGRARGACGVRVCAGPAAASSNTRQRQPGRGDAECACAATTTHGERRSSAQSPDGCNPRALHAGVARLLPRVSLESTKLATMEGVERWKLYAGGAAISVATLYLLRRATKRTGPPPPAWTPSAPGTCVAHLRTIPVSIRLSHQYARRRHCVPCASRLSDACGRVVVGRSREAITAYGRDAVGMWRRRPPWVAAVEV